MSNPELRLIEQNIKMHTTRAESNRQTAEHFLELAELETEQAQYWTDQRKQFLGETTVDNVIPFPLERRMTSE